MVIADFHRQSNLGDYDDNDLWSWSLLLAVEQGQQRHIGHLDDLEANAGNITDGVARATETGNEHLVILLDVVEATVIGHEGGDFFAIFYQL